MFPSSISEQLLGQTCNKHGRVAFIFNEMSIVMHSYSVPIYPWLCAHGGQAIEEHRYMPLGYKKQRIPKHSGDS